MESAPPFSSTRSSCALHRRFLQLQFAHKETKGLDPKENGFPRNRAMD